MDTHKTRGHSARLSCPLPEPGPTFFQHRLIIEGETELGLGLKNLLDSLEWDFTSGGFSSIKSRSSASLLLPI